MAGFQITIQDTEVLDYLRQTGPRVSAAIKRAVRRALAVIRQTAAATVPNVEYPSSLVRQLQNPNRGYMTHVDRLSNYVVKGTLYSKAPGNILETGAKSHWAPVTKRGGQPNNDLIQWLRGVDPDLLLPTRLKVTRGGKQIWIPITDAVKAWMRQKNIIRRWFYLPHGILPRPFVVPAAESAEGTATDAFEQEVLRSI
ncbi:MAG: hypothetical protein ACYCW6_30175 [Candidatus Xenobia bacterium]